MKKFWVMTALAGVAAAGQATDYARGFPSIRDVRVTDGLFAARLETNRLVTVWTDFKKCEETGRIANFENAARANAARAGKGDAGTVGKFNGAMHWDSDVFKIIEGASYMLAARPDEKLDNYLDGVIAKIAAAQEPDGYLYTIRTMGETSAATGPARWSKTGVSHELYNMGHLYEAAVAHYEATGKRALLDVAVRNADLVARTFGLDAGKLRLVPGHEEIELALCKLYRVTNDAKYLRLAKEFLDMRGRKELRPLYDNPTHRQDHLPVAEQREAAGHAVCAMYLYVALADVAALTGDAVYREVCERLWADVAGKRTYLTGGIGSRKSGESFGGAYELPNATAYNETCAAIGYALWNARMWRLTGEAKYMDLLERIVYNGMFSGCSLSGDEFFYPNPLASDGTYARSKWFATSCCPVNVVRFMPQIPVWIYGVGDGGLYWNLFAASAAEVTLGGARVRLEQTTGYPFTGGAALRIGVARAAAFPLRVRIPGWARGRPYPCDLYADAGGSAAGAVRVTVNGAAVDAAAADGYVTLARTWCDGDTVAVEFPMAARRVKAHDAVAADRGRLAVERGPLVYCAEGVDNGGKALGRVLPAGTAFAEERVTVAGLNLPMLSGGGLRLIPYFAWCNRGKNEMDVWFNETADVVVEAEHVIAASATAPRNSEGDFVRLRDGRILFAYTRFTGGGGDFSKGDIVAVETRDEGTTWSAPKVLFACPTNHMNYMSVSLTRLRDGRLAAFFLDKLSALDCRPVVSWSCDEGATWTAPRLCVTDGPGYYVLNNSRIVETRDGTLLMPLGKHEIVNGKTQWNARVQCWRSTDAGATWRRAGEVPAAAGVTFQEPGFAELPDGRVVCHIRTDKKCQYLSFSRDGGVTWEAARPSHFASPLSPMTLVPRAGTDRLWAAWNDNPTPKTWDDRSPMTLGLIDRNLGIVRKWTLDRRTAAEDAVSGAKVQYAYPAVFELGDGRLLVAYFTGSAANGGRFSLKLWRVRLDMPTCKL